MPQVPVPSALAASLGAQNGRVLELGVIGRTQRTQPVQASEEETGSGTVQARSAFAIFDSTSVLRTMQCAEWCGNLERPLLTGFQSLGLYLSNDRKRCKAVVCPGRCEP